MSAERLSVALAELRDAVDFYDRVKAASQDEQIAVGTGHWDRLLWAARKVSALTTQDAA